MFHIIYEATWVFTSYSDLFLAAPARGQHRAVLLRWQPYSDAEWECAGGAEAPCCWRKEACRVWPFCHGCQSVSLLTSPSKKKKTKRKNKKGGIKTQEEEVAHCPWRTSLMQIKGHSESYSVSFPLEMKDRLSERLARTKEASCARNEGELNFSHYYREMKILGH